MRRPTASARRRSLLLAAALLLAPTPAGARTSDADGTHLRLDAGPERQVLSPGDSAEWRVDVDVEDPPSPAEIGLRIGVIGPLAEVPGGMTLAMRWCETATCDHPAAVLPPTPTDALAGEPLHLDGLSPGSLVVTAALPPDAPDAAQGSEVRVTVDARADGLDDPARAAAPPARLSTTGTDLLAPALLALGTVLAGLGLAALRRRVVEARRRTP